MSGRAGGANGSRPSSPRRSAGSRTASWWAPGPGQPDRRAHRLQRRVRAAAGAAAAGSRPRPGWRRARCCGCVRCSRAGDRRAAAGGDRPGHGGRLVGLRRRGGVGAARGRATTCPGWTSSSTATCRSGPGCRRPRRWSAPSRSAWNDLGGLDLSRDELAAAARRAENDVVGAPTGVHGPDGVAARPGRAPGLPRHAVARRRAGAVRPAGGRPGAAGDRHPGAARAGRRRVRRAAPVVRAGGGACSACRRCATSTVRRTSTTRWPGWARVPEGDLLRKRVRHIVTENARVLDVVAALRSGADPRRIGPTLTASHASMRDDFEITVPEVDTAVAAALDAGAHGARMTGGGFGGCVLALVEADAVEPVVRGGGGRVRDGRVPGPVGVRGDGGRRRPQTVSALGRPGVCSRPASPACGGGEPGARRARRAAARGAALGPRPRRRLLRGPRRARRRRGAGHGARTISTSPPVPVALLPEHARGLERAARARRLPVGAGLVAAVHPDRIRRHRRPAWRPGRRHRSRRRRGPRGPDRDRAAAVRARAPARDGHLHGGRAVRAVDGPAPDAAGAAGRDGAVRPRRAAGAASARRSGCPSSSACTRGRTGAGAPARTPR